MTALKSSQHEERICIYSSDACSPGPCVSLRTGNFRWHRCGRPSWTDQLSIALAFWTKSSNELAFDHPILEPSWLHGKAPARLHEFFDVLLAFLLLEPAMLIEQWGWRPLMAWRMRTFQSGQWVWEDWLKWMVLRTARRKLTLIDQELLKRGLPFMTTPWIKNSCGFIGKYIPMLSYLLEILQFFVGF